MLRKFYTILLLLGIALSFDARGQEPGSGLPASKFTGAWYDYTGYINVKGMLYKLSDTSSKPVVPTMIYWQNTGVDSLFWYWNMVKWQKIGTGATADTQEGSIGGPTTTNNPETIGFNPGTNISADSFIRKAYYGILPPTATIGGGTTLELRSGGTVSATLSWSAGRQSNTPPLSTIVVASQSQSFSQPSPNGSVSGTQGVSVPANTTTSYSTVVTDNTGVQTVATTTFTYSGRKYYGWVTDTTGIGTGTQDAVIRALTNQPFATTKSLSVNTGTPTGTQFYVYVYPSSLGALTGFVFNGTPSLEAMSVATRTFTNALGYSQTYKLYWNKQGQTTASDIIAQ